MVSTRSMKTQSTHYRTKKAARKTKKKNRSVRKTKKSTRRPVVYAVASSDPLHSDYVVSDNHCNCPWFTWQCAPGRERAGKKCKHQKLVSVHGGKKNAAQFGVHAY